MANNIFFYIMLVNISVSMGIGHVISRSRVQFLVGAWLYNDSRQVVHTLMSLYDSVPVSG